MQIYSCPEEIHIPDFAESMVDGRFSYEKDKEVNNKFIDELEAWCLAHYHGKWTGKVVSWGVADGAAQYMVIHQPGHKPSMALIHMPLGDAYQINAIMARGLRQKDIIDAVRRDEALAEMFGRKKKSDAAP